MDKRYKKVLGRTLVKHEGNFYICFSEFAAEVNEIGARIFELCNGQNTIADICTKLSSIYDIDEAAISEDVNEFIDILTKDRLIVAV